MAPILASLVIHKNWPTEDNGGWEAFWSTRTPTTGTNNISISHAQRLAMALEQLGPTYVKFAQALGSRPDVVPPSLAMALSSLQDQMKPFSTDVAKAIIRREFYDHAMASQKEGEGGGISSYDLEAFLSSFTEEPVAAASIGQVYKANLPGKGDVAVKVQRPGVRLLVEVS